ncbi:hypothetical protein ACFX5K_03360 [Rickettsiales bacterium LUAb2]
MKKVYINNMEVAFEQKESLKSLDNIPLRMSDLEKELFIKYIEKSKNYLEFGSGGSTFLSLLKNDKINVVSVENDINWLKFLREYSYIREEENKRLTLHFENTGQVGDWGFPKDIENSKHLFHNYSSQVFSKIQDISKIDTVLVDGRFRVACTLNTIKFCNKNTVIIIHDFWNRKHYHILLQFLDVVEQVDTIGVFKVKTNINNEKLELILHHHKNVFD